MKNLSKRKRCVIYCWEQAFVDSGVKLTAKQIVHSLVKFVNMKDMELVGLYSDDLRCGQFYEERLVMEQLVKDSKNNRFDVVVMWDTSHLGYNLLAIQKNASVLTDQGVEIMGSNEPIDLKLMEGLSLSQYFNLTS